MHTTVDVSSRYMSWCGWRGETMRRLCIIHFLACAQSELMLRGLLLFSLLLLGVSQGNVKVGSKLLCRSSLFNTPIFLVLQYILYLLRNIVSPCKIYDILHPPIQDISGP